MNNLLFDKRHVKEYLTFGTLAAIGYLVPLTIFLTRNRYDSLYFLFMGAVFFMVSIFIYCYKLLYKRYDKKQSVSMLFAGLLATLSGIIIASVSAFVLVWFFHPQLFNTADVATVLPGAAAQEQHHPQSYLLMMILSTSVLGNFATGAFTSVVLTYAGKKDQPVDAPVEINPQGH